VLGNRTVALLDILGFKDLLYKNIDSYTQRKGVDAINSSSLY